MRTPFPSRLAVLLLAGLFSAPLGHVEAHAQQAQAQQTQEVLMAGAAAFPITPIDAQGRPWQEPWRDVNGNGRYDPEADPYSDLNGNGKWDGPFLAGFHHFGVYYTAKGVHDPVWARALVIQYGDTKLGLVALDVVGLFYPEVEKIRKSVADLGLTHIIVASTHTHGGTDTMGLWGPNRMTDGKDPRHMEYIVRQSGKALREAVRRLTPARVKFAQAASPTEFGLLINDLRDPIVIDDRILVMALDDLQGRAIATLINWSPHPETIGGSSSLITSDFPHYLREGIEKGDFRYRGKRWKGRGGTAIYFSGAVGGLLSTLRLKVKDEEGKTLPPRSWALTRRIGQIIAGQALNALQEKEYTDIHGIQIGVKKLFIPIENLLFKQLLARGVIQRESYSQGRPAGSRGEEVLTEVNVLTFSGRQEAVAQFVTVPGELFPELAQGGYLTDSGEVCWRYTQRKRRLDGRGKERIAAAHPRVPTEPVIRQHMVAPYQFIIGLANDEIGYIVPANDFVPPVYQPRLRYGTDRCGDNDHYEESMSIGPQAAPRISEAIRELLEQVP